MQITDVRIRKVAKEGKMKAVVSITIDNEFVVHDIKVIEGEKGLFIAMPSRKAADGEYRDIAHPINSDTRNMIQTLILEQYEAMKKRIQYLYEKGGNAGWANRPQAERPPWSACRFRRTSPARSRCGYSWRYRPSGSWRENPPQS